MMILILLLALCQDSSREIESLVRDLGDDLIEVRERAHARLLVLGAPGIPSLRKALNSSDAEVRLRANLLLVIVERADRERAHDADQMEALLRLHRIPGANLGGKPPGGARTEGARFRLFASPFDGGFVIETAVSNDLLRRMDGRETKGSFKFEIEGIADSAGRPLAVERCGRCSPGKVYVKEPAGPFNVRVTGTQVWYCPYDLDFRDPWEGQRKRVGDFTIQVSWPGLKVTSDREFPEEWIGSMGAPFKCTLKEGVQLFRSHSRGVG